MDIKRAIKANGLTVTEVPDRMGIPPVAFSPPIHGNPSVEVLERIAAAIGCNVRDFFEGADKSTITCPKCGTVLEVKERE